MIGRVCIGWAAACALMMCIFGVPAAGSDDRNREAWWKRTSIRIFVDKVFAQRTPGHDISADALALIRDAGFNVICPCWGAEDDGRVRQDAALAERNGLFYLRWMPGTLTAPEGDPHSLTWADGTVQSIYGPNAPALWAWMEERILSYARLSRESALKGVFLDFENYAPNAQGDGYSLSYDMPTLEAFAAEHRMTVPNLPPAERKPWLEQRGLHGAFEQWQQARWRGRARRLREQVDDIARDFLFVVYPYPKTPFLQEIIPLWATARAPAVIASAVTYPGRQPLLSERSTLEMRAADVRRQIAQLKARKFPFLYLGGIDPIVPGADAEFCAKNASVISRHGNGYWVFFEGPDPNPVEPERYMVWFSKANHDIESGCHSLPDMPRRTLPPPSVARKPGIHQVAIAGGRRDVLFGVFGDAADFQAHILDGDTLEYLRQFDLVLIQDFKAPQELVPSLYRLLQRYVEEGGGLLLAHRTLTDFGSPFPELMAGIAKPPAGARLFQGFVEDKTMTVAGEGLEGFASGERFDLHWGPHPVLRAGPYGRVILRDAYEEPTVVIGERGRGRVAFVAPHLGRVAAPTPRQREFTLALSRWLVSSGAQ